MITTDRHGPTAPTPKTPENRRDRAHDGDPGVDDAKITRHLLLVAVGAGGRTLDSIHQDLFDSSSRVVVSALDAVASVGNPASLKFVAKLLSRNDKKVVLHALRTIGALKSPVVARLLFEVYRTTRSDDVRFECLRALAAAEPENQELTRMLREQALSPLASAELRAACGALRVQIGGVGALPSVLASTVGDTVDRVFEWAKERDDVRQSILEYGLAHFGELEVSQRALLIDVAAVSTPPISREAILKGLKDDSSEVRSAAYRATGSTTMDVAGLASLVEIMNGTIEDSYPIEEEAIAAIARLDAAGVVAQENGRPTFARMLRHAIGLFEELSAQRNRVGSETIELGWLILKSVDYLEYYADEEFRQTLVRYLKGGAYHGPNELLAMLKKTAERVEVRHFDGYKALADIIRNPKRPGSALIVRELNVAKLGKRIPFGTLIRALHLLRISTTHNKETLTLARKVFAWARTERLYRLAEAALYVLAKFDSQGATSIVKELLGLPIESKILAIASARVLHDLDLAEVFPSVEVLLQGSTDSHVLLNLIDALRTCDGPSTPGILSGMIALARSAPDVEVARSAGRYLATRPIPNLLGRVTEQFLALDEAHQAVILDAIKLRLETSNSPNVEALSEFLYGFLRTSTNQLRGLAAALLLRLGDEFAPKVIARLLAEGDNEMRSDVVRELEGIVDGRLAAHILKLLPEPHGGLHAAIRRTLAAVTEPETVKIIQNVLLGDDQRVEELEPESPELRDLDAGIMKEKQAFRFEHEFTKELAVMFTDIQGYSAKAQKLTEMQVNSLIQDYEAILLPSVEAHRGRLIKRMGDGHMFVFESPLDAGLAALRVQKALKRFNSYREELLRVVVRIGIHYGQVVQRGGDVFGNNVNIASRLESSSKGGSALVSKSVWERWEGRIHARELGKITVKNITEPIAVFEPYEIQIDLPEELDPLKRRGEGASHFNSVDGTGGANSSPAHGEPSSEHSAEAINVDPEAVRYLSGVFERLDSLCAKVESGELGAASLREELGRSWNRFQELVVAGLQEETDE